MKRAKKAQGFCQYITYCHHNEHNIRTREKCTMYNYMKNAIRAIMYYSFLKEMKTNSVFFFVPNFVEKILNTTFFYFNGSSALVPTLV